MDYAIWSVIQQRVYKTRVHGINELRQSLVSGGGKGGEGGGDIRPGGTEEGAAFGGAKIWNSEIWSLLANCHLHCRQ